MIVLLLIFLAAPGTGFLSDHQDVALAPLHVVTRGQKHETLQPCHMHEVGEMQLLDPQGRAFRTCLSFGESKLHRWWVHFPRTGDHRL